GRPKYQAVGVSDSRATSHSDFPDSAQRLELQRMITGKKIFITGGAGFIASMLISRLADQNEIVVYDNYTRNTLKNTPYANHPNVRQVKGDVLNYPALKDAMAGAQLVVH